MIPAETTARTLIDAGEPVPPGVAAALLEELDLHRRLQTLGGKPPPVDTRWANVTIEPPLGRRRAGAAATDRKRIRLG